jgi:hypothetical protein
VVDSGCVVVSNLARQSLYTYDDLNAPKATALLKRLKERDSSLVRFHFPSKQYFSFFVSVLTTLPSQFCLVGQRGF